MMFAALSGAQRWFLHPSVPDQPAPKGKPAEFEGAGTPQPQSVTLPASPTSPRVARQWVKDTMGEPEQSALAIVVSELVTNAVIHAHSSPRLRVVPEPRAVYVEVFDDGPGRPVVRPGTSTDTSGRGLALVRQLSAEWGVEERPGGKVVWARISARP